MWAIRIILPHLVVSDLSPDLQIVFQPNKQKQQSAGQGKGLRQLKAAKLF